jgi:hypothetical protein
MVLNYCRREDLPEPLLAISLPAFTRNFWIPVHECAVWIVAPRPGVQFVKRGQTIAIRRRIVLQQLSFEDGRGVVVRAVPGVGHHNIFRADQAGGTVFEFVNKSFRMSDVELAVADDLGIDEVGARTRLAGLNSAFSAPQRFISPQRRRGAQRDAIYTLSRRLTGPPGKGLPCSGNLPPCTSPGSRLR